MKLNGCFKFGIIDDTMKSYILNDYKEFMETYIIIEDFAKKKH